MITINSVSDNFFHMGQWYEGDKARYREWLDRQPFGHPAKSLPMPWESLAMKAACHTHECPTCKGTGRVSDIR